MKIPCLIQEQNSYAGITNKWLGRRVDKICVAYDKMQQFFPNKNIVLTGNPIRKDIQDISKVKDEAYEHFKLKKDKKTVLVIGGSLGARSINLAVIHNLKEFKEEEFQLIWQTGKNFIDKAQQACLDLNCDEIQAKAFINKMNYAYSVADIVISRAGALSISELCVVQKACILVPSPNVSEDHQKKNALALVDQGAALMIEDNKVKDDLIHVLRDLMKSEQKQDMLRNNIKSLAIVDADERIVNQIEALLE